MALHSLEDYLRCHEPAFTAACESIVHAPIPAGTAYGLFWFQIDGVFWKHLPLALVWCEHDHGCNAQYPSALTGIPTERWSPPVGGDDQAVGEGIFEWVARCWTNAGGGACRVPFYGHNYHTMEYYCLRRHRYVTTDEITSDIEPVA